MNLGAVLKGLGILVGVVGVVITFGALFMSTSVSTETPTGLYGGTSVSDVYNLGLLQRQMIIVAVGLAIAVAGVALAAAGTVLDAVGLQRSPSRNDGPILQVEPVAEVSIQEQEQPLSAEQLAERDRDLNRATFYVAGGLVAFVGAVFLIIALGS